MEYYTIFFKKKDLVFNEKELLIKSDLENFKKEDRPYSYCSSLILDNLYNELSEVESILKNKYRGTLESFQKHEQLYSNHSIKKVLSNEVYNKYIDNNITEIVTYEEVVTKISAFYSLLGVIDLLKVNKEIYQKLYDLNRLNEFRLQDVLNNNELEALAKEFQISFGTEKDNNSSKKVIDKKTNSSNNNLPPRKKKLRTQIDTFSDDEKYLLLHYCLIAVRDSTNRNENWNYKFTIPDTEFVKIISICNIQDYDDLFLKEKPGNVTYYRRITEGPKYLEKSNQKFNRIKKINFLIDKLEKNKELGLDRTISFLKNINN